MTPDLEPEAAPLREMGIAATSFGGAIYGSPTSTTSGDEAVRARALATVPKIPGAPDATHADTLEFLERCHALGAKGIQTHINGDLVTLRARAEQLGMWIEGLLSVRNSTLEQTEKAILNAKLVGCSVARDAMLSGRRYESFGTLGEWKDWLRKSFEVLDSVVPLLEKHKFTLALENHKDWTADEYADLFKRYSSEYLGACVDLGNNLSLLDDPLTFVETAAPFAKATHIKDMAVQPCPDGFEMSEVPLGTGILDLPKIFRTLRAANPRIRFALEMITRNPLKVACLADQYWITFPDRSGACLARTLQYVNRHKSPEPLPLFDGLDASERARLEEDNIRACFEYAAKDS